MAHEDLVEVNGIALCFETLGDPASPALLLIMGFGVQLTGWEPEFCQLFVDRGFYVIRFDNRDTGRSTTFDGQLPDLPLARTGDPAGAVYALTDMADDAAALLDALNLPAAHVLGTSMGGMIAQLLAIRHPAKVLSLTTIMSTTGDPAVGGPSAAAKAAINAPAPEGRDEVAAAAVARGELLAGGGFPFDAAAIRHRAEVAFDRAYYPEGRLRQQAAILTATDRTEALGALRIPTLVIHGTADPLISVTGGKAIAAAVPDAELILIEGMGHELPVEIRSRVADAVAANADRVAQHSHA